MTTHEDCVQLIEFTLMYWSHESYVQVSQVYTWLWASNKDCWYSSPLSVNLRLFSSSVFIQDLNFLFFRSQYTLEVQPFGGFHTHFQVCIIHSSYHKSTPNQGFWLGTLTLKSTVLKSCFVIQVGSATSCIQVNLYWLLPFYWTWSKARNRYVLIINPLHLLWDVRLQRSLWSL